MSIDQMRKGVSDTSLSGKQVSMWTFIDQVMVKYGPLGVMLGVTLYYIVAKDGVIAEKDKNLMEQQKTMLLITQSSTEALIKTVASSENLARAVDTNTQTMSRLVNAMERQAH